MIKWYIIGGVAVLLMVLFGSNPMETEKKKVRGDQLLNAINEYEKDPARGISKQYGISGAPGFGVGGGGLMNANRAPIIGNPGSNPYAAQATQVSPFPQMQQNNGQNNPYAAQQPAPQGGVSSLTQPLSQQPAYNNGQPAMQPVQPQAQQPNYAPVQPQMPGLPGAQSPFQLAPGTKTLPGAYLRSGEKLQYAGTRVYKIGGDGRPILLADGVYTLSENNMTFLIRHGERQIYTN